jgi:hypothetical protein
VAGKIVADIIEAPVDRISLNVANVTVASINTSGIFSSTGNLLITQAGTIGIDAIADGAIANVKIADLNSSKLTGNVAAARITDALNASGDAPIFACRAWVNFDGTGTVAIRASGNVSSITDNGTGDYTVNFTTAMPDANYTTVLTCAGNRNATDQMVSNVGTNGNANANNPELYSTTQVRIRSGNTDPTFENVDVTYFGVVIFR